MREKLRERKRESTQEMISRVENIGNEVKIKERSRRNKRGSFYFRIIREEKNSDYVKGGE